MWARFPTLVAELGRKLDKEPTKDDTVECLQDLLKANGIIYERVFALGTSGGKNPTGAAAILIQPRQLDSLLRKRSLNPNGILDTTISIERTKQVEIHFPFELAIAGISAYEGLENYIETFLLQFEDAVGEQEFAGARIPDGLMLWKFAWVYQTLAHRQGLSIPYFFGVFDIITPSREAAWVLVLEFIPGPTIHDVAKSMSTDAVHDFCTLGLDAVRDSALSGWTLRDIRCADFILTGSPGSRAVVMIDLYDTEHVIPPPTLERLAMVDAKRFFDAFQNCVRDDYPGIHDWARQNLPLIVWNYDYDPSFPDSEEDM
ncbi:hypothetical protein B0H13DRAFT_2299919 [Mycena leptocephala]|nr:hypothetical protein B0H13DRAFT_2299919 [Mycena leptocephala]